MSTITWVALGLSVAIIAILAVVYFINWQSTKLLIKSVGIEIKKGIIGFISFSLFFGFVLAVIVGSLSATDSIQQEMTDLMIASNASTIDIVAGDLYTKQTYYDDGDSYGEQGDGSYDRGARSGEYGNSDWAQRIIDGTEISTNPNLKPIEDESSFYSISYNDYLYAIDYTLDVAEISTFIVAVNA